MDRVDRMSLAANDDFLQPFLPPAQNSTQLLRDEIKTLVSGEFNYCVQL